jgi:hypothetical protein
MMTGFGEKKKPVPTICLIASCRSSIRTTGKIALAGSTVLAM